MKKVDDTSKSNKNNKNNVQHQIKYKPGHGLSRYNNALKNLLPLRHKAKSQETMAIDRVGLLPYIYMSWLTEYIIKASKTKITSNNLPSLSPYDNCSYNAKRLEILWKEELKLKGSDSASFGLVVWRFVRTRIFVSTMLQMLTLAFGLLSPMLIMRKILANVQSTDGSILDGFKWVLLLAFSEVLRTVFFTWMHLTNCRTAARLRSACLAMLYKKIVNLHDLGGTTAGEFIAIFSNDGQRVYDLIVFGPMIASVPIVVVVSALHILYLFHPVTLTCLLVFFLFYFAQYVMSCLLRKWKRNQIGVMDLRLKTIGEILDSIKVIKIQALEEYFSRNILDIRDSETKWLQRIVYLSSTSVSLVQVVSTVSAIAAFLAYFLVDSNLTAAEVFPLLSLLNSQVRSCYQYAYSAISNINEATITYARIKKVLLMEKSKANIPKPIVRHQALGILNGRFTCDIHDNQAKLLSNVHSMKKAKRSDPAAEAKDAMHLRPSEPEQSKRIHLLTDITFEAAKGKVVGICGQVGSGKSSLLLAALGQLKMTSGQMARDGTCAFVSQQSWIINASFRENVVFGETFDSARYYRTLALCCLEEDLDALPGGDETEIGERGVNLSGGQRQRIALARAFYANRDIYLLDDPLSAVDACVALEIFENLILSALANKTVILVTHQVQCLSRCSDIYVMRSGRIVERGSHGDLMRYDREYAYLVKSMATRADDTVDEYAKTLIPENDDQVQVRDEIDHDQCDDEFELSTGRSKDEKDEADTGKESAAFMEKDTISSGGISLSAYGSYAIAAGGYWAIGLGVLTFFLNIGSNTFSNWWLAVWVQAGSGDEDESSNDLKDNPDFWFYYWVYAACIGLILLTTVMRSLAISRTTVRASTTLHNAVIRKMMAAPIKFFDTTPSGRIYNLFSSDVNEIDIRLSMSLEILLQNAFIFAFSVFLVLLVFVWYIVPFAILCGLFVYYIVVFRVAARDLKRLENSLRSPIYSFISMTTQGLSTIQAFNKENEFIERFENIFDQHGASFFLSNLISRWLAVRFDSLTAISTCVIAMFVVCLKGHVIPAFAGLAMVQGAQISGIFQYTIRVLSDIEVHFISVERICFYLKNLVEESTRDASEVAEPWPSNGEISIQNLSLSYGKQSHRALDNVSFTVKPREKIGIVGRTGSGKTSLMACLLRLYELESGVIKIDDVDISRVDLKTLRHKMTVIPQDNVLFIGTVRSYLDPGQLHPDADIWEALDKSHMKGRIMSTADKLDYRIDDYGKHFSMGEKQLLCLARAMLHRNKILILDEATASMDLETEAAIHEMIEKEFKDSTTLIIAHRIHNILSCDRILVLSNGRIVEFDDPETLLANPASHFTQIYNAIEDAMKR